MALLLVTLSLGAAERWVVYVDSEDLTPRQHGMLEAFSLAELHKLENVDAVAASSAVEAQQSQACVEDQGCLAKIASALGTTRVISIKSRAIHDSEVITVKLLDLESAEVTKVVSLSTDREVGVLAVLGRAVEQAFPDYPLRGSSSYGVATEHAARWRPEPLPSWGTWVAAGGTGVLVALSIAFGVEFMTAQSQYNNLVNSGGVVDGAVFQDLRNRAELFAIAANITWVATALSAAGTIAMALFTDWGSDAVLAPVFVPSYSGVSVGVGASVPW